VNRSTRRTLHAVLVAAGTLGVAACQPAQVGAAAVVDGRSIPVSEIQQTVTEIRAFQKRIKVTAASPETLARRELQRRLFVLIYDRAARELGVDVTPGEVSAQLATARRDAGDLAQFDRLIAGADLTAELLDDAFRQRLQRQKMGEVLMPAAITPAERSAQNEQVTRRLVAAAKKMDVDINPRFGDFDAATGAINDHVDDFLAPAQEDQQPPAAPVPPGGQG